MLPSFYKSDYEKVNIFISQKKCVLNVPYHIQKRQITKCKIFDNIDFRSDMRLA